MNDNVVTVIRHDFETAIMATTVFSAADRVAQNDMWEVEDALLSDLQRHQVFTGYYRWCDLEPYHYRILMASNIERVTALPIDQLDNGENKDVASLNFLTLSYIRCMEERSGMGIDLMRIHRTGPLEISYVVNGYVSPEPDPVFSAKFKKNEKAASRTAFRMVVNNDPDS